MVKHAHKAGRTDHDVGEVARLHICQRIELPVSAANDANARVLPFGRRVRTVKAQGTLVTKHQASSLQLDRVGQRRNTASSERPAIKRSAGSRRHALVARRGEETLPFVPSSTENSETASQFAGERCARFCFAAIIRNQTTAEQAEGRGICAFKLDCSGQRTRTKWARSASARHPDSGQALRRN